MEGLGREEEQEVVFLHVFLLFASGCFRFSWSMFLPSDKVCLILFESKRETTKTGPLEAEPGQAVDSPLGWHCHRPLGESLQRTAACWTATSQFWELGW